MIRTRERAGKAQEGSVESPRQKKSTDGTAGNHGEAEDALLDSGEESA
jgi:hypothetical protein